jgi:hypothetical protein
MSYEDIFSVSRSRHRQRSPSPSALTKSRAEAGVGTGVGSGVGAGTEAGARAKAKARAGAGAGAGAGAVGSRITTSSSYKDKIGSHNDETKASSALKRASGAVDGAKLSLVGCSISLIDKLSSKLAGGFKIVYLSNNNIKHISGVEQFQSCRSLSLANNMIRYLDDLHPLGKLPEIEKLMLEGNPVTTMPYYREYVLSLCSKITVLDGNRVSVEERLQARNRARKISVVFEQMRMNELRIVVLQHYSSLSTCHREMCQLFFGRFRYSNIYVRLHIFWCYLNSFISQ